MMWTISRNPTEQSPLGEGRDRNCMAGPLSMECGQGFRSHQDFRYGTGKLGRWLSKASESASSGFPSWYSYTNMQWWFQDRFLLDYHIKIMHRRLSTSFISYNDVRYGRPARQLQTLTSTPYDLSTCQYHPSHHFCLYFFSYLEPGFWHKASKLSSEHFSTQILSRQVASRRQPFVSDAYISSTRGRHSWLSISGSQAANPTCPSIAVSIDLSHAFVPDYPSEHVLFQHWVCSPLPSSMPIFDGNHLMSLISYWLLVSQDNIEIQAWWDPLLSSHLSYKDLWYYQRTLPKRLVVLWYELPVSRLSGPVVHQWSQQLLVVGGFQACFYDNVSVGDMSSQPSYSS